MSDLIKRQAAINELVRWGKVPGYSRGERNVIACVISMLDTLPSEQSEIIRCKDCKHHHRDNSGAYYCGRKDYGYGWGLNDFCSDAERRTDG